MYRSPTRPARRPQSCAITRSKSTTGSTTTSSSCPKYGSIQCSQLTLDKKAGNAFDTSSLLVALLRAANIPARYVYGTVDMPLDKAMNWVGGVTVGDAAQHLLGQGGIPHVGLTQGGQFIAIRMEHVWVEAWVDFYPSRSAKNIAPDTWVPMDGAYKQYLYSEGLPLEDQDDDLVLLEGRGAMLDVIHMALPMDGRIWRVEWIGSVRVNPFSPQELEVSVAFRRVGLAPPYVPTNRVRIERVGVSTLCKLPLGSMWRDGRYVGEHPAMPLHCEVNLQTGSQHGDVVGYDVVGDQKKKKQGQHGNHVVPIGMGTFYAMRIQISKPRSKLKRIIIPLFEIARSWFLRDSELTLRLTSGPIASAMDKLYDPKQSTIVEQGPTLLAIHPGLSEGAIPTIAMLACDPYSRMVASRMVNRLVSAFVSKESVGLETLPPLQERWTIHAVGSWGEKKDKGSFYVYRMTAIQMPTMGEVEWFRLGGEEPVAAATGTTDEASPFDEFKTRRSTARVTHQLDPSARHGRTSATVEAAPMLNPPIITKRPMPPPVKETRGSRSKPSKGDRSSTDDEVSTGVAASWSEGMPSFRYKVKRTDDEDNVSSRVFLPAGLEQMVIIIRHLKKDAELKIRAVGGTRASIHPSGIVTTSLSDEFSWSLIEGKVRQSLTYEVLHTGRYFYLIEVERRYEKEELSTCLVARLDGRRFTSADIDRLLDVYARKRGSWTSVHDPYWKRTLAHKFKDVLTFSERLKSILVKRGNEMNKEAAAALAPPPK